MKSKSSFWLWIALLTLSVTGCSSRIVNISFSPAVTAPSGKKGPVSPLTYNVIASRYDTKEVEKALRDSLQNRRFTGSPSKRPDGEHLHLIIYALDPVPSPATKVLTPPLSIVELVTLGLVPLCTEQSYPIEIHTLAGSKVTDRSNRTTSFHAEYTLNSCFWLPTFIMNLPENEELRHSALRGIFDQALDELSR